MKCKIIINIGHLRKEKTYTISTHSHYEHQIHEKVTETNKRKAYFIDTAIIYVCNNNEYNDRFKHIMSE